MRRAFLVTAAFIALMPAIGPAQAQTRGPGVSLDATLKPYLERYGLPALSAAVVKNGRIVASGVVGTRRLGANIPATINDRFHIGSDTKAMTSLLAAMLVEEGKLKWDSTVAESFSELAGTMAPGLGAVTLAQLLSHIGGISSDTDALDNLVLRSYQQDGLNLDELRYWVIKDLVTQPLQSKPGEKFAYSNLGYTLVGAMLERASKKTWEELIVERVFTPLGLKTAGLGPQSSLGRVDAPLGHKPQDNGPPKVFLAGPNGDNPELIGPAGTAHMSVLDFAAWAAWNAGELKRGPQLVKPATLMKLHTGVIEMANPKAPPGTPALGNYGYGWLTVKLPFASGPMLYHGGSNEKNLAYIFVDPQQDFALVMMTNLGGGKAEEALKALSAELYKRFAPAAR